MSARCPRGRAGGTAAAESVPDPAPRSRGSPPGAATGAATGEGTEAGTATGAATGTGADAGQSTALPLSAPVPLRRAGRLEGCWKAARRLLEGCWKAALLVARSAPAAQGRAGPARLAWLGASAEAFPAALVALCGCSGRPAKPPACPGIWQSSLSLPRKAQCPVYQLCGYSLPPLVRLLESEYTFHTW